MLAFYAVTIPKLNKLLLSQFRCQILGSAIRLFRLLELMRASLSFFFPLFGCTLGRLGAGNGPDTGAGK